MRLAMLTPAPDYGVPHDWAFEVQAEALRNAGAEVVAVPWTEADELSGFDLILPLVTWGYHLKHDAWLAFLDRLEAERLPVANPPSMLRWNSDKAYLAELGRKGVPVVPTLEVDHLNEAALAAAAGVLGTDELVVKPPVSASAWGTFRLHGQDSVPMEVHGRRMLIQPYLRSVTESGEYSLILFGGELSHTVAKLPKDGDFRVQPEWGGSNGVVDVPAGALDIARAALAQAPGEATYARVDLLVGDDGGLQVIELELIEPALFMHCAPEAKPRFAAAVLRAAA
jgi:glutathione synthase/RimK-type ligase-like ATP-grasp enzyme